MPARRRFAGSESDDNFTIVVDDQNHPQTVPFNQQQQQQQFEEKEKYPNNKWNLGITNFIQSTITTAISSTIIASNSQEQQIQPQQNYDYIQQQNSEDNTYLDKTFNNSSFSEFTVMTARDRTTEFSNAIRSLQGRNITRAVNIKDPRKAKQLQSYGEFMTIAKHIGKNIASTYSKLEKLTLLAKRKSLFDDRPMEIQELTYIIKGDLNSLNQQIARLQDVSKSQRKLTNGKHLLSHSSNMVLALQAKLANMSTDFKQILEVRTENLKHQKNRRDQFSQGIMSTNLTPSSSMRYGGSQQQSSLLLSEQDQVNIDLNNDTTPLLSQSSGGGVGSIGNPGQQMQKQQQMMLYDESDRYVQERSDTMQNIESTIVELGGIFQQLAHMVKEQEELVERIDTNVQDAELNIDAAHGEILRYFQSVTKNRWLMIKIFGVLIFFFIFFVMFLA